MEGTAFLSFLYSWIWPDFWTNTPITKSVSWRRCFLGRDLALCPLELRFPLKSALPLLSQQCDGRAITRQWKGWDTEHAGKRGLFPPLRLDRCGLQGAQSSELAARRSSGVCRLQTSGLSGSRATRRPIWELRGQGDLRVWFSVLRDWTGIFHANFSWSYNSRSLRAVRESALYRSILH